MGWQSAHRRVRLYRANGEIIAVVEAKRTTVDPRLAEAHTQQRQAEHLLQTLLDRAFQGQL